jgi:hypothetical protein
LYQIPDQTTALLFGGWKSSRNTEDIDIYDFGTNKIKLFDKSLVEKDMITKRPIEVGDWILI